MLVELFAQAAQATPPIESIHGFIDWFFKGAIGVLLLMVWFGVRKFFADLRDRDAKVDKRDEALQGSIDELSKNVSKLSEKFVLKSDYERDLQDLRGRRLSDRCPLAEDCPHEASKRQTLELSDSGAKSLKDLLAAARAMGEQKN